MPDITLEAVTYETRHGIVVKAFPTKDQAIDEPFMAAVDRCLVMLGDVERGRIATKDGRPYVEARVSIKGPGFVSLHYEYPPRVPGASAEQRHATAAIACTTPTETLEAIDALLSPIEQRAKAIDDGLEKRAENAALAAKKLQRLYVTPDHGELPADWAGVRKHPEVAPLIEKGYRLVGVTFDFAGRRVAEMVREKPDHKEAT